jgi:hypothetical protein
VVIGHLPGSPVTSRSPVATLLTDPQPAVDSPPSRHTLGADSTTNAVRITESASAFRAVVMRLGPRGTAWVDGAGVGRLVRSRV